MTISPQRRYWRRRIQRFRARVRDTAHATTPRERAAHTLARNALAQAVRSLRAVQAGRLPWQWDDWRPPADLAERLLRTAKTPEQT